MLSRIAQATTKASAEYVSIIIQEAQKQYSTVVITDQESDKIRPPIRHCDKLRCPSMSSYKLCKDSSHCDKDTTKVEIAFHVTHSLKGVEPDKVTTELDTTDGHDVYAVMHEKKETVQHAYEEYRHADTQMMQEDANTKKIQEALKQQEEINEQKP